MFRFHFDPCVFLWLSGLRYVVDGLAACDELTTMYEYTVCLGRLGYFIELLGQAVRDCYLA